MRDVTHKVSKFDNQMLLERRQCLLFNKNDEAERIWDSITWTSSPFTAKIPLHLVDNVCGENLKRIPKNESQKTRRASAEMILDH